MIFVVREPHLVEVFFSHQRELESYLAEGLFSFAACELRKAPGLIRHWWFAQDYRDLMPAVFGLKNLETRFDHGRERWLIANIDVNRWPPMALSLWNTLDGCTLGPGATRDTLLLAAWETAQTFDESMNVKFFGPTHMMLPENQMSAEEFLKGPAKDFYRYM